MARTPCTNCSATVPNKARFCPRCGQELAGAGRQPGRGGRAHGALPSSSPMPLAGILFLVASVLGPTLIAVGVSTGRPLMLVAGIVISVLVIVLLLVGMVF
jgi:hypothetical protein